ncbi:cell envelope integrity protein CreD [Roseateles asaccharophilus]|uniref:Inner membrane protein n=1 Tax=Roseateles asaccharophilus TaxID=582607 RepID=A0ABU2A7C1_9BURK|nr:cell envelope integrity protein CreD [Roseateles asaccharophilus]MDR7333098.1 inner membrane protein [Roseateles asaccharophilus]
MSSHRVAMLGGMNNRALFIKLAILAVVSLLLCAVLAQIDGLVNERQARQQEAQQSVVQSQAGPQTLLGPLLLRHCKETWSPSKDSVQTRGFAAVLPPTQLQVGGRVSPDPRHRGLFKINSYAGKLTIAARWDDFERLNPPAENAGGRVECGDVIAMFSTSDARGLRDVELKRDGRPLAVKPGTLNDAYPAGLHAVIAMPRSGEALELSLAVEVVGTQRLAVVPAAGSTAVNLQSSWQHPSFGGRFLPAEREVSEAGFSARWQVSELASRAAADAAQGKAELDTLAVDLMDPVNPYVMSDRAIKYGLMFIALTFVTVGLTEVLTGRRVHPVQYLLVGLALSLFFLLLLSLSEHLPFVTSYLIAAGAAAAVLTQYAAAMLGGWLRGLAFGGGIALLYGALYVLLSREQTALVIGAVLLFGVLAAVMTLTRRLDWYRLGGGGAQE